MEKKDESLSKLVRIVCPPAEYLSVIVNNVRCEECGLSFSNEPRLRMHVLKIHEHKSLKKTIKEDVRYHCPEIMCVYSLKSQRYFTTMKYLKQHYLKVHAAKTFACTQCEKSFSTEAVKLAHLRICGVQFTCSCSRVFSTYEALLTHGKRMSHTIDEKYKKTLARKTTSKIPSAVKIVQVATQRGNKPVSILPHRTDCSINCGAKITFDIAVQTDDIKRHKRTSSPSKPCKRRESRQTQTSALSKEKRARKTVETQTSQGARLTTESQKLSATLKKAKSSFTKDLSLNENFSADNLFPGSPLELQHDVGLQDFWEEKNTSLGTQTSPEKDLLEAFNVTKTELVSFYDRDEARIDMENKNSDGSLTGLAYVEDTSSLVVENGCYTFNTSDGISRSDPMLTVDSFTDRFSSIETQTEIKYSSSETFFDPDVPLVVGRNFALSSNNETQTTENFDNIEQLLYSNTCTQTCNDILPSDLGLSDIQTQTAWPDLEDGTISAQTQTGTTSCRNIVSNDISTMSSPCRSWLNTRMSHTETQTDLLSIFDEFQ